MGDGEEEDFAVRKQGSIKKFFPRMKRPTQRKFKEEKIAKKKTVTLEKFLNVSKKGKLHYLSDPDDPDEIKIMKDTQSKSNPGDKDYEENPEMESDDGKDKEKDTEKEKMMQMEMESDDEKDKEKDTEKEKMMQSSDSDDEDFNPINKDKKYKQEKKQEKAETTPSIH